MADVRVPGVTDLVEVGRGATAIVYRGTQRALGRTVAVKVLTAVAEAGQLDRFERECRAIGSLSGQANVVTVHDAGVTDAGRPYLVMEYLPRDLAGQLAAAGPMPWPEVVALGSDLAAALGAAHAVGVLHRDVKPQNVMLTADGRPKLADFGLARFSGAAESRTATVTASFTHASPELVQGLAVDERSDVYSLASTLHEALRGAPPFVRPEDTSLVPIIARIVGEPPPSLAGRGVPTAVEDVIVGAMAKDPDKRPASAQAFAEQLRDAGRRAGLATVAASDLGDTIAFRRRTATGQVPVVPGTPASAAPPRRRGSVIAGLVAVVALAIGGIAWATTRGDDPATAGDPEATTTLAAVTTAAASTTGAPTTTLATTTAAPRTTAAPASTTAVPTTKATVATTKATGTTVKKFTPTTAAAGFQLSVNDRTLTVPADGQEHSFQVTFSATGNSSYYFCWASRNGSGPSIGTFSLEYSSCNATRTITVIATVAGTYTISDTFADGEKSSPNKDTITFTITAT